MNLLKIDFTFEKYKHLEYKKNENMSIVSFKCMTIWHFSDMHGIEISVHFTL